MYLIFKLMNIRNRAYVIDSKGNKIFYGTEFQCKKFVEYMKGDDNDGTKAEYRAVKERSYSV